MKTIINSQHIIRASSDSLPDNIMGVAITDDIGHSGIFIRYDMVNYVLHFNKEMVRLDEVPPNDTVLFKQLTYIHPDLIRSSFNFFQKLNKKSIQYGYFYSGSFFDYETLEFIDENSMPEIMSCVGFCLNVLKTVLRKRDFIKYSDWSYHEGIEQDKILKYLEKAKENYPGVDLEEYIKHVRRILPLEYFTAGFQKTVPVLKEFTDANSRKVHRAIEAKLA